MTTPDPLTDIARDLWDACPDVTDYPPGTVVVRQMPDGATEVVVYPQGPTDGNGGTLDADAIDQPDDGMFVESKP